MIHIQLPGAVANNCVQKKTTKMREGLNTIELTQRLHRECWGQKQKTVLPCILFMCTGRWVAERIATEKHPSCTEWDPG